MAEGKSTATTSTPKKPPRQRRAATKKKNGQEVPPVELDMEGAPPPGETPEEGQPPQPAVIIALTEKPDGDFDVGVQLVGGVKKRDVQYACEKTIQLVRKDLGLD